MVDSKQQWKAWLYLAPAIALLLVFTVWPIFNTVRMAFLENYKSLEAAGGALNIFGGPLDAKDSWMDENHYSRYNALAEEALAAVSADATLLHRVKTAVMPIWSAGIVLGYGDRQARLDRISRFAAQARKLGLERVEEWTITPDMFITDSIAALNNA